MQFLAKPIMIVGLFISFKLVQLVYFIADGAKDKSAISTRFAAFIMWLVLSYLAFQGKKTAQWLLGIMMILHMLTLMTVTIFAYAYPSLIKMLSVLPGVYFAFGGVILVNHSKGSGSKFLAGSD